MSALWAALAQLHFLRPWWLLALLLVPLLAWRLRARARRRSGWREAVDAHLLPHLLEPGGSATGGAWTQRLALLGLLLALLALAGPSLRKQPQPLWQSRQPLVVALDLSRAALARDLPPTRLAQARAKLASLLRERAGGQVALVAFAEDAYTVAPLTDDAGNVALFLDALAPDVMPADGQRIDRAIAWSQRLLQQAGFPRGDILLLTDHADAAAIAMAAKAAAAGYRVSALGLGTAQGGVFETPTGLVQARLDAPSLRALATSGGGGYRALAADAADLHALGVLEPRQADGAAARGAAVAQWQDDGAWLLPLVLACFLPLFRRGNALVLLLAGALWLQPPPARAQDAGSRGGTLWQRADQLAHARLQAGIAAYRTKDYPRAIEEFSGLTGADAQYNLGNALAQAGRYDEALAAYDRALRQRPDMADARYNRAQVEAARRQQQQQQQQQQNQQQQQQQQQQQDQQKQQQDQQKQQQPQQPQQQDQAQQQNGQQSAEQPASPGGRQEQQPGQQDAQQSAGGQPPPDAQQDGREQAQADAAQRQRMQEALHKRQGQRGQPQGEVSGSVRETPEQRERRLANEAWLQRVPDDPGALLRARFQLEARRRREGGGP
ncbi:VWA domain-containing protein [Thermomonas fusca]|uniref:VWA domain-containing protein n=1 Tax=Thermomonas fusca TaxID=215690 RepID=A0A5R9PIM4_9GAMM|nr:VWA domain-containing protein [Thermomonas fusca]TLX23076.1 VWA domain-containing protein [Thermomonas fusca]